MHQRKNKDKLSNQETKDKLSKQENKDKLSNQENKDKLSKQENKDKLSKQEERIKELRSLCASKRGELQIKRSSKISKEAILDKTLKEIGIDKDKFKKDLEALKKQGGLEINLK